MSFTSKRFIPILLIATLCLLPDRPAVSGTYLSPDEIAVSTDETSEKDIPTLVTFLTKDLQSDSEKARAIAVWIATHITFDDYKQRRFEDSTTHFHLSQKTPSSGDIFVTRKGISSDYAYLFKEMAAAAGLKAAVIKGYYKGYRGPNRQIARKNTGKYDKNKALWYWNAISIGDSWQLVDTSIAVSGAKETDFFTSDSSYKADIAKRTDNNEFTAQKSRQQARQNKNLQPDEKWFFVKPTKMIETHFPEESAWQLKPNITSEDTFFN